MFFSLLPIGTTMFAVCVSLGVLAIDLPLSAHQFKLAGIDFLLLVLFLAWTVTPLAYRFLARAFPLNASGAPNYPALRAIRVLLGLMLAICGGLVALCWSEYSTAVEPIGISWNLPNDAITSVMSNVMLEMFSIVLLSALCLTYGFFKVLMLHRDPAAWRSQRFTLFLRSFGSVSDVAAIGPLVRAAGGLMRVALLSTPSSIRASWNPLTLVLSGFSLRRPFRSVPVFLESTDESWAEDVQRMARAAEVVVIDVSHHTPGLSHEIEMLSAADLSAQTVRVGEQRSASDGVLRLEKSLALRRTVLAGERDAPYVASANEPVLVGCRASLQREDQV
jgi:hypothetical protein